MPTQNKKLATLAALAGLTQQLSAGPRQEAELAAHEQQNRVSAALQLLGLQQQQQSEAATQAFHQSQLAQSGSQFNAAQTANAEHEANRSGEYWGGTYPMEQGRLAQEEQRTKMLGENQAATLGEERHYHDSAIGSQIVGDISRNNPTMPIEQILKLAGLVNPSFGAAGDAMHQQGVQDQVSKLLPTVQNTPPAMLPQIQSSISPEIWAELQKHLATQAPPTHPTGPQGLQLSDVPPDLLPAWSKMQQDQSAQMAKAQAVFAAQQAQDEQTRKRNAVLQQIQQSQSAGGFDPGAMQY